MELTKLAQNTVLRWQIELTKSAQNTVLRWQIELTKSVTYIYGKATLTWFEEIFEEYKSLYNKTHITKAQDLIICVFLFYSMWIV